MSMKFSTARNPLARYRYGPATKLRKPGVFRSGKAGASCAGLPSEAQISPSCSTERIGKARALDGIDWPGAAGISTHCADPS